MTSRPLGISHRKNTTAWCRVGIKSLGIIVTDIQGKWEMIQNKNAHEFEGVRLALSDSDDPIRLKN